MTVGGLVGTTVGVEVGKAAGEQLTRVKTDNNTKTGHGRTEVSPRCVGCLPYSISDSPFHPSGEGSGYDPLRAGNIHASTFWIIWSQYAQLCSPGPSS